MHSSPYDLGGCSRRSELAPEKLQDLVASRSGWLTGLVDEMGRHDTMRRIHVTSEKRGYLGVCGAIGQDTSDETITKGRLIRREALSCATCHLQSDKPRP